MRALRFLSIVLPLAALLLAPARAQSAVLKVPADFPSIQAAIDAAANGDTVLVSPGTYLENINFHGKAITVTSKKGPKKTVIDGRQKDTVATFTSGEGPGSVLNGFTLRNGRSGFDTPGFGDGGGIWIRSSSPTITGNVIADNRACTGIGVSIVFGSPLVQGNTITGNVQQGCSGGTGGGGVGIGGNGAAQLVNNVISSNFIGSAGGGISLFAAGNPILRDNVISDNTALGQGGGIWIVNISDAAIIQNVITRNTGTQGGGIYWGVPDIGRGPLLVNNTIADNSGTQGSGIFAAGFDKQATLVNNIVIARSGQTAVYCDSANDPNPPIFRFNDIFAPLGAAYGGICTDQTGLNGNLSADPLFFDPGRTNYRLQAGSPAIDAGDNAAQNLPPTDLDKRPRIVDGDGNGTVIVDMGAYERSTVADVLGSLTIDGSPVVDAPTTLKNTKTGAKVTTMTDGAGDYQFDVVPPGSYQITIKPVSTVVTASVSGNLQLRGLPSEGNTVKLKNLKTGTRASTSTDANGNFFFADVQPGTWALTIKSVAVP